MKPLFKAHNLLFEARIDEATLQAKVRTLGEQIRAIYSDKNPLFIGVLNGAFIFAADLIRACGIPCEIDFVRLSSYKGMQSSGVVQVALESKIDIKGRHLIIVEDIVDTGNTLRVFCEALQQQQPASIAIAAMLVKTEALQHPLQVDFTGFEIPPDFVIGYGLDYNEQGRHLPGIYTLVHHENK